MALKPHPVDLARDWPHTPIDDPSAEVARLIAVALRQAIGERSVRDVARVCGLAHPTILAILNGTTWPDLFTTVRLEEGLEAALWPDLEVRVTGRSVR